MAYASELERLPITYRWALDEEINQLMEFVRASTKTSLITVGSGGALTNAVFASVLHQYTGMTAQYFTPLELISSDYSFSDKSVLIITAGGNNPDVLAALSAIIKKEPQDLTILCGSKKSRIQEIAKKYEYVRFCGFESPCLKDGFLATNSVLAFAILLLRAYREYLNIEVPSSFGQLLGIEDALPSTFSVRLKETIKPILGKNMVFALFGKCGKPAAYDLESKLIESALRIVNINDYRNFAHGRHNWLAKKGSETGVLAFVTEEDKSLAEKTLGFLPPDIQVAILRSEKQGPLATLELLTQVLLVTDVFGKYDGVDPGRPRIPAFGRNLFHLKIPSIEKELTNPLNALSDCDIAAIERKTQMAISKLGLNNNLAKFWVNAYLSFFHELALTLFDGVVFDYDGTLCSASNRFIGPSPIIGEEINELLDYGICIGIATGRGDSVRTDLRRIIPQRFWPKVVIGYYNGSDIGLLCDDNHPNINLPVNSQLAAFLPQIDENLPLKELASYKLRPKQITFYPKGSTSLGYLFEVLYSLANNSGFEGIQVLESSHSIDILAPRVSKRAIIQEVKQVIDQNESKPNVLCVGDKGRWPGNDFALLSTKYSLSVDSVSPNPDCCWNLAPVGFRGIQATEYYFNKLKREKGQIRLRFRH